MSWHNPNRHPRRGPRLLPGACPGSRFYCPQAFCWRSTGNNLPIRKTCPILSQAQIRGNKTPWIKGRRAPGSKYHYEGVSQIPFQVQKPMAAALLPVFAHQPSMLTRDIFQYFPVLCPTLAEEFQVSVHWTCSLPSVQK